MKKRRYRNQVCRKLTGVQVKLDMRILFFLRRIVVGASFYPEDRILSTRTGIFGRDLHLETSQFDLRRGTLGGKSDGERNQNSRSKCYRCKESENSLKSH